MDLWAPPLHSTPGKRPSKTYKPIHWSPVTVALLTVLRVFLSLKEVLYLVEEGPSTSLAYLTKPSWSPVSLVFRGTRRPERQPDTPELMSKNGREEVKTLSPSCLPSLVKTDLVAPTTQRCQLQQKRRLVLVSVDTRLQSFWVSGGRRPTKRCRGFRKHIFRSKRSCWERNLKKHHWREVYRITKGIYSGLTPLEVTLLDTHSSNVFVSYTRRRMRRGYLSSSAPH